jgi:uncharacterized protein
MKLDLDRQDFGRSELDIDGTVEVGMSSSEPVQVRLKGQLDVQNLESRFLVDGVLQAHGRVDCGRCLEKFELRWDVPVQVIVLRNVDSDENEGETLMILQQDGEVDLTDSLRDCSVLSYPQTTVCKSDCKGLCATCGIDLNQGTCECVEQDIDPRWEGLPG